jgi:hypothetical protein
MRKAVASLTIGLVLALGFPGSAWAKGAESVTISGGDLDSPLVIPLRGPGPGAGGKDVPPPYLVAALDALADPFYVTTAADVPTESSLSSIGDLDHYTLTWHTGDGRATIVQDVYPNLGTGPMIHTRPSASLGGKSGWYEAPAALRDTLAALGAPISGLPTGLPTLKVASPSPSPSTGADGVSVWTLPAVTALGLACGFAAARARSATGRRELRLTASA